MDTAEGARKLVHASGAIIPAAYLLELLTWSAFQRIYLAGLVLVVALETARLYGDLDWWIYRKLTREYEQHNPAGYALYVVGSAAAVLAFPPRVAVPAVLILSIADPVAGALGANDVGDVKRPMVLATTFLISGAIAALFVPLVPALLGALAATVADGVKPVVAGYVIDDNLTIPAGTALAMWAGLQLVPSVGP